MIKIHKHNESHVFVECAIDEAMDISKQFEFYAPNYIFSPKYKSGVWDGKIRLFSVKTCFLPQGLLKRLITFLKTSEYRFEIIDKELMEKGKKISSKSLNKFKKLIKLPSKFEDRNHQNIAVQNMLYHKKMIALSATNSGKSLVAYLLFNILKYLNDEYKFLMVVPNVQLVEQMTNDFSEYGEEFTDYNNYVHKIYTGKQKYTDKPITISTWQSLQRMDKKYFQQFDVVLVDECHTAGAKQLSNIVEKCYNAEYKIGMSGTLKNTKVDLLQLEGLFGSVRQIVKSKELIKKGYATKLKINGIILDHHTDICRLNKSLGEYKEEVKLINSQKSKMKYICKLADSRKQNTLVLFRLIKYGKSLKTILEKFSKKKIFYIDGSVKVSAREKAKKYCENNNDTIIIASYDTFSTGISIKNLHNIIFSESMKSSIKILQSIGRLLRIHKGKKYATLFDIADNLTYGKKKNYFLKHFLKRIEYYESEDYDYKITNVKL